MGCGSSKVKDEEKQASSEARRISLQNPNERTDVLRSLKLGLDPLAPLVTSTYDFGKVLGKGYFGEVLAVTHRESPRRYACQILPTEHIKMSCSASPPPSDGRHLPRQLQGARLPRTPAARRRSCRREASPPAPPTC